MGYSVNNEQLGARLECMTRQMGILSSAVDHLVLLCGRLEKEQSELRQTLEVQVEAHKLLVDCVEGRS